MGSHDQHGLLKHIRLLVWVKLAVSGIAPLTLQSVSTENEVSGVIWGWI